ncbi:Methylated-DNA--protein-cysteine methyltransferase, constitutive [Paenibacillus polymyxa E681]|uniref:methylated-DNA--[protein]-cysteine S-methyltransferase n=1 Tax=Paenibacillus polymyxa TaxID=1406 RepID=UPI0001E31927|nr:methylated-DNA--[protein]-cysteine S-methyltransferase [Paenibacillus polymyxa]ADM71227.1 methylated-DNA--protein-cysteine S-methyltransferase [Paenibacillus polymyxa E681]QNV58250.1 Methylated-DNA--protein-cysteine methyltransferase, constitutive [Paenibacillus polymyxa E681]QNV63085.1 Methylated-DNA--protein-cysteine methyltransferase, constitutive [Paenibacillus polymyxa E681]
MSELYVMKYVSPIGEIEIQGTNEAVYSIMFSNRNELLTRAIGEVPIRVLAECAIQLDEYFKGERFEFTFPYAFEGTDFQQKVWNALVSVGYGKTTAYKDIALAIGNEKAIRAVGSANGKNKLSIVIPCHRIIGSNQKLTGYAGGLWRKEWLLQHEKRCLRT